MLSVFSQVFPVLVSTRGTAVLNNGFERILEYPVMRNFDGSLFGPGPAHGRTLAGICLMPQISMWFCLPATLTFSKQAPQCGHL